jgi:glycine oxidase
VAGADVIITGGGLAGVTTALACARRGLAVTLIDGAHRGSASRASAGVLGPSIGRGPKGGRVGRFMFAARDRFPGFLDELCELTGIDVPMVRGALELALNDTHLAELRARAAALPDAKVLGAADVAALEGALVPVAGALHHPRDGAIDVRALRAALDAAVRLSPRIAVIRATVTSVDAPGAGVTMTDGTRAAASHVVLACGAWVSEMRGLPRALPVRPVKGEVAVAAGPVAFRHVVFGAGGYLVPRGDSLLVGATSEDAGFDAEPTAAGAASLAGTARALVRDWPRDATFGAQEAGLRPMTPDGYPILGRDPDVPALLYACGYSRNGVLVSPLAADCLAALIAGDDPGFDLTAFAVARFGG